MNFFTIYFIFTCFVLWAQKVVSQKQADWWYFGANAGIHFVNGVPIAQTNGQCNTIEGCSVISDANGNLLFYTDGIYVWNKNHANMQNGTGLLGNPSATQSGVIVPKPGSNVIYYVFSVDDASTSHGLHYSEVDLSYNSGLGKVTNKNIALSPDVLEKITAVKHSNGTDFWVTTLPINNDSIYSYLITSSGVTSKPIASKTSVTSNSSSAPGYVKISPDGKKLAYALYGNGLLMFGDFDASTGKCTNVVKIDSMSPGPYGVEFSPKGFTLFCSQPYAGKLFQYNLKAGTTAQIKSSKKSIPVFSSQTIIAALQVASNGKIYVSINAADSLAEISNPDSMYPKCKFKSNAVYLKGKSCQYGLPTFIQSYFLDAKFNYSDTCVLDSTNFSVVDSSQIDSAMWVFGDSLSGSADTSFGISSKHKFTKTGNYKISLYYWYAGNADTTAKVITIDTLPVFYFPTDTFICGSTKTKLSVPQKKNYFYEWNTGDTTSSILADTAGIYWVEVSNCCGAIRDSVNVVKYTFPNVNLGNDTIYCSNFSRTLDATNSQYKYLWNTGDTTATISVSSAGKYIVKVYNTCYTAYDTIVIQQQMNPVINMGADTLFCGNFSHTLDATFSSCNYSWNTSDTAAKITINKAGLYIANVTNFCGTATDSITITNEFNPSVDLGNDTFFCNSFSKNLDAGNTGNRFLWNTGDTTQIITANQAGTYTVKVYNNCYSVIDWVDYIIKFSPNIFLGNDTTFINSFSYPLNATFQYSNYLWNNGTTDSVLTIDTAGTYFVKVYNQCGFTYDTITIKQIFTPKINLGNDTIVCGNFSLQLNAFYNGEKYLWNTGDTNYFITVSQPGMYSVKVSNAAGIFYDSINIIQQFPPKINLGNDTFFCDTINYTLNAFYNGATYLWNTGDTTSSLKINAAGKYSVTLKHLCGNAFRGIDIKLFETPQHKIYSDSVFCGSVKYNADATQNTCKYLWNTHDTSAMIAIYKTGKYIVEKYNMCGSVFDSLTIDSLPIPIINLNNDTTFCDSFNLLLDAAYSGFHYLWNTGDTTQNIAINSEGKYFVNVYNGCGNISDTVNISRDYRPNFSLGNDTTICPGSEVLLDPFAGIQILPHYNISWNNLSPLHRQTITQPGIYSISIKDSYCNFSDTIIIKNFKLKKLELGNDKVICTEKKDIVILHPKNYFTYLWIPDNSTLDSFIISQPSTYFLTVTDTNNCTQTDSINVTETCPPHIYIPNTFSPNSNILVNRIFKPSTMFVDSYTMKIFDRWGEEIYSGNEKDEGWNGTFKNNDCKSDMFIWVITYFGKNTADIIAGETMQGTIILLR